MPASTGRRIPVARNTVITAALQRCWNDRRALPPSQVIAVEDQDRSVRDARRSQPGHRVGDLIDAHLTLQLARDILVIAMLLRDRDVGLPITLSLAERT